MRLKATRTSFLYFRIIIKETTSGLTSAELSLLHTQPDGENGVDIDCGVLEPVGELLYFKIVTFCVI